MTETATSGRLCVCQACSSKHAAAYSGELTLGQVLEVLAQMGVLFDSDNVAEDSA